MKSSVISEVVEASFSIYLDSDRKDGLSVCEVTRLDTLDENGAPVPGGLYDSKMGPVDQKVYCGTCRSNVATCPGHPGHIELDLPVYYPLYFAELVRLLRSKCLFCHKLRMSQQRVRYYLLRLMLLEMGDVEEASTLFDSVAPSQLDKGDGEQGESTDPNNIESKLRKIEIRYKTFLQTRALKKKPDYLIKSLQRELIDSFMKANMAIKKCENCNAFSPPIRKDGASKIFQRPIPVRQRKSMSSSLKQKSAMEELKRKQGNIEDDDTDEENLNDEEEEEEEDDEDNLDSRGLSQAARRAANRNTEADKYLHPQEVEAQIKMLWLNSGEILNFIWCRALGKSAMVVDLATAESWRIFFMRVVLIPPNRFRPMGKVGDVTSEHPQNIHLKKILEQNLRIRVLQNELSKKGAAIGAEADEDNEAPARSQNELSRLISAWIQLQDAVNCYMDSSKDPNPLANNSSIGIRQLLERKEGLFRRNMMGKRVNYCCRSVISPDPYMGSNEIGIPVHFAKNLHYPTPVNSWNVKHLRTLVERGPDQYPGANQLEMADGHIIKLDKLSDMERKGKAKLLLSNPGIKVYRHLVDGDVLLVNRQPTLHKPGIMAHKARVLTHVKEQTLRMNYANCNTYNADFDGDEMNCHFVQSELARAEAYTICNTDNQYIVPTSGNPLRGLIQDHVASAVKLTCKDTFLDKAKFQQLVYIAVSGLPGTEIVASTEDIILPSPVILKPKPMWTGKQVITALLANLCRPPLPPLQLDSKARTPPTAFGADQGEHEVMIRNGELLTGVLDKNAIGNVSMGLIHAVYELYGAELAGRLLNAFGRLMTYHLQTAGHSCGISDLVLTSTADAERNELLRAVNSANREGLIEFLQQNGQDVKIDSTRSSADIDKALRHHMALYLASDRKNGKVKLDGAVQGVLNKSASNVIKACLPNGLQVPFLQNNFSMMVLTGAKGSAVNQSQISCFLGQQALEGQRVPVMASGKTLPSFRPFDGSARAGGFVRDRFLTGVRPQEYYFHCMAGREGLVDTAVKTSRSGYLQRCLVKHLEELTVAYDNTVRDSAGNVIQFLYGEDGLDPVHAAMLGGKANQMLFLARNHKALSYKYSLHNDFFNQGLQYDPAVQHHSVFSRARDALKKGNVAALDKSAVVLARKRKDAGKDWSTSNVCSNWFVAEITKIRPHEKKHKFAVDLKFEDGTTEKKVPIMVKTHAPSSSSNVDAERLFVPMVKLGLPTETAQSKLRLGNTVGAVSEKIQDSIVDYVTKNPDKVIHAQPSDSTVTAESLELLIWIKYMRSLACPGEAVGCVAAQSIGEPSTQMTLNTFHLAGHGGANVTLGIPRLREIIMTASKTLKTPMMVVPLAPNRTMEAARSLARKLSCLPLVTLLHHQGGVEVGESMTRSSPTSRWERQYRIRLQFEPMRQIEKAFGVTFETIAGIVQKQFLQKLDYLIKAEQRRAGESTSGKNDALKQFLSKVNPASEYRAKKGRGDDEDGGNDNGDIMDVEDDEPKVTGKGDAATSSDSEASENEDSDADTEGDGKQRSKAQGYGVNTKEQDSDDDEDEEKVREDAGDDNNDNVEDGDEPAVPKTPSKTSLKTPTKSHVTFKSFQENKPLVQANEAAGYIELFITFPIVNRRLLMIQLVEKACAITMVRSTKSIAKAYPLDDKDAGVAVQTEGVNFEAIWSLPDSLVNYNNIQCNDINAVLNFFGVEAARQCIVSEVQAVFKVYGIDVNPRHLALIADFMTRFGEFTPMNRMGMMKCSSPFLQMSFETTCTFLTRAAQEGLTDNMNSASARIVTGCVPKGGTGAFEILLPLQQMQQRTAGGRAENVFPRSNGGGALFDFDMTMDE